MSRWAVLVLVTLAHAFGAPTRPGGRGVGGGSPPRGRGRAGGLKRAGLALGGLVGARARPPRALAAGGGVALAGGGALALVSAALPLVAYRSPAVPRATA